MIEEKKRKKSIGVHYTLYNVMRIEKQVLIKCL